MSTPTVQQTIQEVHADFFTAVEEMDVELMKTVARQYLEMGWDEEAEEAKRLANKWQDGIDGYDQERDNQN